MPSHAQRIAAAEELWDTVPDGQAIAERKLRTAQAHIRELEVEVAGLRAELTRAYAQIALLHTSVPA